MLSYNLDFNSCAIRDGFRKSSHIHMSRNSILKVESIAGVNTFKRSNRTHKNRNI